MRRILLTQCSPSAGALSARLHYRIDRWPTCVLPQVGPLPHGAACAPQRPAHAADNLSRPCDHRLHLAAAGLLYLQCHRAARLATAPRGLAVPPPWPARKGGGPASPHRTRSLCILFPSPCIALQCAPPQVADRISFAVTLLLTSAAYKLFVSASLPDISYLTLIDRCARS